MKHDINDIGEWITKNRWVCFFISIAIICLSIFGMSRFKFTAAIDSHFDPGASDIQILNHHNKDFTNSDGVVVVVTFANSAISNKNYAVVKNLTDDLKRVRYNDTINSIATISVAKADNGDMIIDRLDNLYDLSTISGERGMVEEVKNNKSISGRFVSIDGKSAAIYLSFKYPTDREREAYYPEIYKQLRDITNKSIGECGDQCDVFVTGRIIEEIEITSVATTESPKSMIAQCVALFFALLLLSRSIWASAAACFVALAGSLACLGVGSLAGMTYNTISIGAPPLMMALLFAQSVHLISHYLNNLRRGSDSALAEAINSVLAPTLLTSLITVMACLSFNGTSSPGIRVYGNSLAIGSICGTGLIFFMLPFFLALIKTPPQKSFLYQGLGGSFFRFVCVNNKAVLIASCCLILALSMPAFNNRISDFPRGMVDKSSPYRIEADSADKAFGVGANVAFTVSNTDGSTVASSNFMKKLAGFAEWCRLDPRVSSVNSFSDTVENIVIAMGEEPEKKEVGIPDSDSALKDYIFLYEMSLPYGSSLRDSINHEKTAAKVTVSLWNSETSNIYSFSQDAKQWMEQHDILGEPTGMGYIFAKLSRSLVFNDVVGSGVIVIMAFILFFIIFRSASTALLASLPIIMPISCGLGIWSFFDGRIGITAAGAIGIAVGVIVDETLHIVTSFNRLIKDGKDPAAAGEITLMNIGPSIVVTGIVLMVGFAATMVGNWTPPKMTAGLMGIMIGLTLIFQFTLLIPSLILIKKTHSFTKNPE